jgi:hypothetical protein
VSCIHSLKRDQEEEELLLVVVVVVVVVGVELRENV